MSATTESKSENGSVVLATWLCAIGRGGAALADAEVGECCRQVHAATDAASGDKAGLALIEAVSRRLGSVPADDEAMNAAASQIVGPNVLIGLGDGSRDDRLRRVRGYQFKRGLPWIARIVERRPDGSVGPSWLLVERVTDQVRAMDPNPWDDVDEERVLPLGDFQVLWELGGCFSLALG